MKKGILSMLLVLCVALGMSTTALAASTTARPEGFVEASGTISYTYAVGEAFRSKEVGLNIYEKNGPRYYGDNLEFSANGIEIHDGYKFKEVGKKVITVKRGDKQATYQLQVTPALNGNLKECSIVTTMGKTTYKQSAEGFDPQDIVVKCVFTDGSTQNIGYQDMEFYAGVRGMKNYTAGHAIKKGYLFVGTGKKDLIVRVMNKEMRIPFTVTAFSNESIDKAELTTEPANSYVVGEAFRADEYTFRYYYTNGTTENFSGSRLNITANGVQIHEGYVFKVAGTKKIVVSLGDYSVQCTLVVRK